MSFIGDAVENLKQTIGWKSKPHGRAWKAYQAMSGTMGPFDTGHEQMSLTRRQFYSQIGKKARNTLITQYKDQLKNNPSLLGG